VPENSAADPDNVQDENGKDDASEASESAEGPEKAEKPGQEGSEVPNDDGPGGHADEPGNPNADHQFQARSSPVWFRGEQTSPLGNGRPRLR